MPKTRRGSTTDAVEILHHRYYEGRPERLAALRADWEAWNDTMPAIPADATVSLGYGARDMPQR